MTNEDDKITTVSLKRSTKERLEKFGTVGDSYDDVLNGLMDISERVKK